jgi:hypothetical protein
MLSKKVPNCGQEFPGCLLLWQVATLPDYPELASWQGLRNLLGVPGGNQPVAVARDHENCTTIEALQRRGIKGKKTN